MARARTGVLGLAVAGAAAAVATIVVLRPSSAQRAIDLAAPVAWNDFSVAGMPPSEEDVRAAKADASSEERDTCAGRMRRVLASELVPDGFADHLLPLCGWGGGNVFVLRQTRGAHVIQVTEGAKKIVVEIRKADGSPMVEAETDLPGFARSVAECVLAPGMQPREFHAIGPTEEPGSSGVAVWLAQRPVKEQGLALFGCRAYSDGSFVRYEFREVVPYSKAPFEGPPPYLFGAPAPVRTPVRMRPEAQGPKQAAPAAPERVHLKTQLTPEEMANQAN